MDRPVCYCICAQYVEKCLIHSVPKKILFYVTLLHWLEMFVLNMLCLKVIWQNNSSTVYKRKVTFFFFKLCNFDCHNYFRFLKNSFWRAGNPNGASSRAVIVLALSYFKRKSITSETCKLWIQGLSSWGFAQLHPVVNGVIMICIKIIQVYIIFEITRTAGLERPIFVNFKFALAVDLVFTFVFVCKFTS